MPTNKNKIRIFVKYFETEGENNSTKKKKKGNSG